MTSMLIIGSIALVFGLVAFGKPLAATCSAVMIVTVALLVCPDLWLMFAGLLALTCGFVRTVIFAVIVCVIAAFLNSSWFLPVFCTATIAVAMFHNR